MRYFKISINEEGASDSMTFAAESEKDAWKQFDEMTGGVPRNLCQIKAITKEVYEEENPPEEESPEAVDEEDFE